MDICSEIEWYKVAQLAWPEASTIVDVGANKGEGSSTGATDTSNILSTLSPAPT